MSGVQARLRVVALSVLALNALGLLAFTLPRRAAQGSAAQREAALRADVGREQRRLRERQVRADAQRDNARDLERLQAALAPRAQALVPMLEAIEKMARDSGLRPRRRRYSESELPGTGIVRVEIELPLEGRYAALVDFLERVEVSGRPLSVDALALQRDAGQARLRVRLSAWFAAGGAS